LFFAHLFVPLHTISDKTMGILGKIFGRKQADDEVRIGGMEDFMMLIRVYFQAELANALHITNLNALPDLRTFKVTLKVPTQQGRLGVGEKARCRKMLKEMYEMDDQFFKEVDQSISHRCRKVQDAQPYLMQFQAFVQDLMMLTGNLMKFKLRMPSFFKKAIYGMTEKTIHDIYTKNDYKDAGVIKTVVEVRELNKKLNFSEKWSTDFVYRVLMLAKKEKRPQNTKE